MNSFANGDPRERQIDGLEIFKSWNIYERIIHGNWMRHRELRSALQETLGTKLGAIKVLDVGSGDGRMAYAGLETTLVARYVALYLSQPALESLQQRPSPGTNPTTCDRDVLCGDFTKTILTLPESAFEVVLCSYSLHHLENEQKRVMLNEIARVMVPGGQMLWIDTFRMDDETRERYLTRLGDYISDDWTTLSESEREEAVDHIWSSDFPETEKAMLELLADVELIDISCVWNDDLFGMWKARKSASA